ncbi:ACP phosphodiesterase [Solitalea koreensis]|uniref:Acyl carrier protein phosphodiesterase n=1 Tax=Solitalea koreensis TaxID=543615 RepID=A0A521E4K1_9SPHI|nr:ACP phosphodiesterase [Solitalea koreensis]SMO78856.1 Protein of unknown function, DUF479 [Solitalea koreensis]
MNFLSHFYFDQQSADPNFVLGLVLPDLAKNFDKTWNIHPHLVEDQLLKNKKLKSVYLGWQRHLLVDKLFHSSPFFEEKTAELKKLITPLMEDSPVRPFILAHIALELLLDNLLIDTEKVEVADFYRNLESADRDNIVQFLAINSIEQPQTFFNFFDKFNEHKYLYSYTDLDKLVYALNRICYRIWKSDFSEEATIHLQKTLNQYKNTLKPDFMSIFKNIQSQL